MTSETSTDRLHGATAFIKKSSGWFIATAAVFVFLGIFAVIEPGVAGLAVAILVGWLLILGGLAHLAGMFSGGGTGHILGQVLIAFVYFVGGVFFVTHPFLALGTLTLLLAVIFLAEALSEVVAYWRMRREHGSVWLLVNALVTLFLGGLIWLHWPSSSVWAIGTLLGANLVMAGISRLIFGLAARRFLKSSAA